MSDVHPHEDRRLGPGYSEKLNAGADLNILTNSNDFSVARILAKLIHIVRVERFT